MTEKKMPTLKIGIDIDGCITEYPKFFSILTTAFKNSSDIEIFIITARDPMSKEETVKQLEGLGIVYDQLIITDNKQKAVEKIDIFIDNQIENFKKLDSNICCLLLREEMNYCWESYKFLGDEKTIKMI